MNSVCYGFKNPKDNRYYKGGCAFTDDLATAPDGRVAATARMLFLEDLFGIDPDQKMSLEEFRFWDQRFAYEAFDFCYWIEEAQE